MRGVECELVDEVTGLVRRGYYRIDEGLQGIAFRPYEDPPVCGKCEDVAQLDDVHVDIVVFSHVVDVLRWSHSEPRFPEGALKLLDREQKERLLLLTYGDPQFPGSCRQVCLLETSVVDRESFLTCVRILRRYMDEQG